jgi:hypothetical protein
LIVQYHHYFHFIVSFHIHSSNAREARWAIRNLDVTWKHIGIALAVLAIWELVGRDLVMRVKTNVKGD